jgi:F0F1-type ATP synthase membrane subunit c/vacuolar-type H+-ATPase subunit K
VPSPYQRGPLYAPPSKMTVKRYGGLLWAGLFIVVGIVLGVLAGLQYSKYTKQADKKSTTAKNAQLYLFIFAAAGGVCLLIGIILAFVSVKKLKS